jgi:nucleotide-binding universal stress UspA family protein
VLRTASGVSKDPVANLMIGSVATKVIHLVEVPVTLIK